MERKLSGDGEQHRITRHDRRREIASFDALRKFRRGPLGEGEIDVPSCSEQCSCNAAFEPTTSSSGGERLTSYTVALLRLRPDKCFPRR